MACRVMVITYRLIILVYSDTGIGRFWGEVRNILFCFLGFWHGLRGAFGLGIRGRVWMEVEDVFA